MAKRVRGSRAKASRAGGQVPTRERRPSEAAVPSPEPAAARGGDIDAAIDTLYLEEAELTLTETPAPQAARTVRARREPRVRADSLSARMAADDVYVREDLRRIAVVSAILFAGLALAWFLFVFLDLLGLY